MYSLLRFPSALPPDLATLCTLASQPSLAQAYTRWAQLCPKHQAAEGRILPPLEPLPVVVKGGFDL